MDVNATDQVHGVARAFKLRLGGSFSPTCVLLSTLAVRRPLRV